MLSVWLSREAPRCAWKIALRIHLGQRTSRFRDLPITRFALAEKRLGAERFQV